ncbi:hypothetical protein FSP39_001129 [Pinctada imbricata]|uniref:Uncharacterized protein n=1 Tax=Pinctada imbricata TaxID=66713 RepID=A0AA89BY64_PINIB|nr:hypothetical protein FSP39_001129 [Pinctada imbricata]
MFIDHDLVPHVISCKGVQLEVENAIKENAGLCHEVNPNRTLTSLHHAIDTLHYALDDSNTYPVQLVNEVLEIQSHSNMTSSFIWDEYLYGDLMISIYYDDDSPVVTLQSPEKHQFSESDEEYIKETDTRSILIYVPKIKVSNGKWTLNVMNWKDATSEVHILVKSTNITDASEYPITVRSWTKLFNENGRVPKVGIYTDVIQGHHPLSDVTVTAHVHREDGKIHVIELFDNGAGADIEKHDGIYSRYYPYIHQSPGSYHVDVHVTDSETKGVIVKKEIIAPTNPELEDLGNIPDFRYNITKVPLEFGLTRTTAAGTIRIPEQTNRRHFRSTSPNSEHSYLPVRVHDLKIIKVSKAEKSFVVSWTAPGSHLDHGKASYYNFIYHNDTNLLLDSPEMAKTFQKNSILNGNKSDPAIAGSEEKFKFRMPAEYSAIGFRLCAVSSHNKGCEYSNMVTVGFPGK